MQNRVLISTIPVVTSVAKPSNLKKVILKVIRTETEGGDIIASVRALAVSDLTDPRNPVTSYSIPTPKFMEKFITSEELTIIENLVIGDVPAGITSVYEKCHYIDLLGTVHLFVTDPGGAMFGLASDQWEIIEIDNEI